MFQSQLYNIFKVDLLGPCASPIEPTPSVASPIEVTPVKPARMKPIRPLAVGACA
jgi:hypothetical protein